MTNEELVALIQAGDHVSENMTMLYQQNRRFIAGIALPFSNSSDLESAGSTTLNIYANKITAPAKTTHNMFLPIYFFITVHFKSLSFT